MFFPCPFIINSETWFSIFFCINFSTGLAPEFKDKTLETSSYTASSAISKIIFFDFNLFANFSI